MSKTQFRTIATFSENPPKVDRENGVIYGVQVVQEGLNKNNSYFSSQFLSDIVKFSNAQGDAGIRSNFGHPAMCSSSLGTYLGRKRNFELKGNKVFADLHLDPITKKTNLEGKGISMFDWVCDMAENNPDQFGCSIHLSDYVPSETPYEKEGVKYDNLIFSGLVASDIVDYPAATEGGLFSYEGDLGVLVTNIFNDNPQLFERIAKDPSVVTYAISTYSSFLKIHDKQKFMSLSKEVQAILSGESSTFDIETTLANGEIVKVITENDTPMVGDRVEDSEGNLVPNDEGQEIGTHLLPDTSKIITKDGVITEIVAAEEEEQEEEQMSEDAKEFSKKLDNLTTMFSEFKKDSEDTIKLLSTELKASNDRFNEFGATVQGIEVEDFIGEKFEDNNNTSIADRANQKRKENQ